MESTIILILVVISIIEHLYFLWLEMFAWETVGKKTFTIFPKEIFAPTKPMAANQGLYNGFLAAGLIWSLFISNALWMGNVQLFFFSCIIVAGIYGGLTISKKIFFIQAIPAIAALLLLLFSR